MKFGIDSLLIAGTDTEVGKTVLTSAMAAYWQIYRPDKRLGLLKLLQTGTGDRERYRQLFGSSPAIAIATPLAFHTPVAPPLAAEKEGRTIDLGLVWQEWQALQQQQDFVLVEALGGLGSPVTHELTVADLAGAWHLPTVLVVPVKLGALGQAVANVALARQCQVNLKGIVLSCPYPISAQELEDWAPKRLMQSLTQVPVVGILPHLPHLDDLEKLAQVVSDWDLEALGLGISQLVAS